MSRPATSDAPLGAMPFSRAGHPTGIGSPFGACHPRADIETSGRFRPLVGKPFPSHKIDTSIGIRSGHRMEISCTSRVIAEEV
jgi:hypothetical protein